MRVNRLVLLCCVAQVLLFPILATRATAYFTYVGPGDGDEPNLEGVGSILDHLYGWNNLSRVDDSADQIWWEYNGGANGRAKFAHDRHRIGYSKGVSGGAPVVFDASLISPSDGYSVIGGFAFNFTPNDYLRFSLYDINGNTMWSSLENDNVDDTDRDHMVTYRINSGPSAGHYVLAWEDLPGSINRDYNDMVFEVTHVTPVPEPASMVLVGLGLATTAVIRRRRR